MGDVTPIYPPNSRPPNIDPVVRLLYRLRELEAEIVRLSARCDALGAMLAASDALYPPPCPADLD